MGQDIYEDSRINAVALSEHDGFRDGLQSADDGVVDGNLHDARLPCVRTEVPDSLAEGAKSGKGLVDRRRVTRRDDEERPGAGDGRATQDGRGDITDSVACMPLCERGRCVGADGRMIHMHAACRHTREKVVVEDIQHNPVVAEHRVHVRAGSESLFDRLCCGRARVSGHLGDRLRASVPHHDVMAFAEQSLGHPATHRSETEEGLAEGRCRHESISIRSSASVRSESTLILLVRRASRSVKLYTRPSGVPVVAR